MEQSNPGVTVPAQAARTFDRISGELKAVISRVEGTAGSLASEWQGQSGDAAQSALARFREVATRQVHELNEILGDIHTAGLRYPSIDVEQDSTP